MNYKLLYKVIGSLLFLLGALLAACIVLSIYYDEDDMPAFLIASILTISTGFVLKYLGRDADNNLSRRDAYLLVTATWVVFSLFGMLPFLIGGYIPNVTDAFFETMSGFTTTGATILTNIDRMPHTILYWRSMTQWIGGLGIVFFTIAILPSMVGSGSVKVFAAEATGPMRAKMHPRLSTMAKWIWTVYLGLTIACIVAFYACGMEWFDSINYALTTTATGGFAPHDDPTYLEQNQAFNVKASTYVSVLFQFLAGINFALLYMAIFKLKIGSLFRNSEFKVYLIIVTIATFIIAWLLVKDNGYGYEHAFRSSLFHVSSVMTSTGFAAQKFDYVAWGASFWMPTVVIMAIGACAGSTAGGIKVVRILICAKSVLKEFVLQLHPRAVIGVRISGHIVPDERVRRALAFIFLYIILVVIAMLCYSLLGADVDTALGSSISMLSNVGPATGSTGPASNFSGVPAAGKWLMSAYMLIGRLEIFTILFLFMPSFWKERK